MGPEFAKRSEVTVSTMGKVHNPNGDGVPAVSSAVTAKKKMHNKLASTATPPPSPAHRSDNPANNHHHDHSKNQYETKVKEEGSSRRNITRKKSDGAAAGGHYDSRNKKHGGAGKGMWGEALDGSDALPMAKLDENDPLYDDFDENVDKSYVLVSSSDRNAEDGAAVPTGYDSLANKAVYGPMLTLSEFKIRVTEAVQEYFDSADHPEVIRCIRELNCSQYHPEIIKRAVSLSLDKSSREKELVSRLLSILHPDPLTDHDIAEGFELLLDSLDDLSIDAPDAKSIVGTFLARAVMDEVLPPAFLSNGDHSQAEVVEKAMRLLSREHCGVRLEHVWGPGDGRPVQELKVVMDQLLKEYLLSRELDEAARCIREMNSPHFHHELVKRGATIAMDERDESSSSIANLDAMAALFSFLVENAIVSDTQVVKGLRRLHSSLNDLKLDVSPKAPEMLNAFEVMLQKLGILPSDYIVEQVGTENGDASSKTEG